MNNQGVILNHISNYLDKSDLLEFKYTSKSIHKQLIKQLYNNNSHRLLYDGYSGSPEISDELGDCRVLQSVIYDKRIKKVFVQASDCHAKLSCETAEVLIIDSCELKHVDEINMPNLKELHILKRGRSIGSNANGKRIPSLPYIKTDLVINEHFAKLVDLSRIQILHCPLRSISKIANLGKAFPNLREITLKINQKHSEINIIFPESIKVINIKLSMMMILKLKHITNFRQYIFSQKSFESTKNKKIVYLDKFMYD